MINKDLVCWNSLINGMLKLVLNVFDEMSSRDDWKLANSISPRHTVHRWGRSGSMTGQGLHDSENAQDANQWKKPEVGRHKCNAMFSFHNNETMLVLVCISEMTRIVLCSPKHCGPHLYVTWM